MQQGRKAGVPPHKLVAWVRRKLGTNIAVWRHTSDGTIGCAAPCLFCARELQRFDLRVHCPLDAQGGWFSGRLGEPGAPQPALTGGQQRVLRQQGWGLCREPQPPSKERLERQELGRLQAEKRRRRRERQRHEPQHSRHAVHRQH